MSCEQSRAAGGRWGNFFFSLEYYTYYNTLGWLICFAHIYRRSIINFSENSLCVCVCYPPRFLVLFLFFHTINGRCNDVRWCHISTHPTKLGIDMQPFSILFSRPFGCFVFFFSVCANCRRCIIGRFFGRYKALLKWCYFLFCFIQCAPFSRITKRISVLN